MERPRRTFFQDFKQFFLRGLAVLLPSVLTLVLLWWVVGFLWDNVARPINSVVRSGVMSTVPHLTSETGTPSWARVSDTQVDDRITALKRSGRWTEPRTPTEYKLRDAAIRGDIRRDQLRAYWDQRWYLRAIGFLVAIVAVYLVGLLIGNMIGRSVYQRLEGVAVRIPVIKQVYPSIKQFVDFTLGEGQARSMLSGRVVALQYPRPGVWTVGLETGPGTPAVEQLAGRPCATVFIPSSPTPFTGYTITVPKEDLHDLPLTLDDAIKFVVSGGVLTPQKDGKPVAAAALPASRA